MNLTDLWLRLRALLFRRRTERDLQDELRFHLEMQERKNIAQGIETSEAQRRAYMKFGSEAKVAEECRDERRVNLFTEIDQDMRYAFALFARRPGFTAVAVLTLALGIGANIAVFSVVNAVLLRPLHVPDPDRLVRIIFRYAPRGVASPTISLPGFNALRETSDVFQDISAHRLDYTNVRLGSDSEQVPLARVTANFLDLFEAPIISGRAFTMVEDRPGGEHVALLSYSFSLRHYARYQDAVGQRILLGGEPYTVIGVIAPSFDTEQFDQPPVLWVPFQINPLSRDVGGEFCFVTARLKVGIGVENATARLQRALEEYRRNFAGGLVAGRLDFIPLRDAMVTNVRASLLVLLGAVTLVLLIACANVANLLLMQATSRKRELAIRSALGAHRWRLIRQLLTESGLLSLAGGGIGLVLGIVCVRGLLTFYPENNPFLLGINGVDIPRIGPNASGVNIDWRVTVFTIAVSCLATLLFAALPALKASRTDVIDWLKQAGSTSGGGSRQNKLRATLVVAEVAIALTLLIGTMLFIRTSRNLQSIDPGFDPTNVLTLRMSVTATPFDKRDGIAQFTKQGTEGIRALTGVTAASTTCCVPLETVWQLPFIIAGRELTGPYHAFSGWTFVSPGYFGVFRIPILRGRDFTTHDDATAPGVAIINETMARLFWPTADPLDDSLIIGRGVRPDYDQDPIRRIVGIVGDVRSQGLSTNPRPEVYVPVAQVPDGVTILNVRLLPLTWVVRTATKPELLAPAIEDELKRVSEGLPVGRVRSMDSVMTESTARVRFYMWLMTMFGCCAVILALVGVYSVAAYSVQQRTQEIGIRMSLGASRSGVRNMVLLEGISLGVVGVITGDGAAFLLTKFLSIFLYGVTPTDGTTFLSASVLLSGAVLGSMVLPARIATRVNPSVALRFE